MKRVMVVAWKIAKKAAAKFGGSPIEYMSEALKYAWKITKATRPSKQATLVISAGSRKYKSWVAKIGGTDARYGFKRTFIDAADQNWTEKHFVLGAGVYEVCDAGERYFIRVSGGKITRIERPVVA